MLIGEAELETNEGMLAVGADATTSVLQELNEVTIGGGTFSPTSTATSAFEDWLSKQETKLLADEFFDPEKTLDKLFNCSRSINYSIQHQEVLTLALQHSSHKFHELTVNYLDQHLSLIPNVELQQEMFNFFKLELACLKVSGQDYTLLNKCFNIFACWLKLLDPDSGLSLMDKLFSVISIGEDHESACSGANGAWLTKKTFALQLQDEVSFDDTKMPQIANLIKQYKSDKEVISYGFDLLKKVHYLHDFNQTIIELLSSIQTLPGNFDSFLEFYLSVVRADTTSTEQSDLLVTYIVNTISTLVADEERFDLLPLLTMICRFDKLYASMQEKLCSLVALVSEYILDDMNDIKVRASAAEFIMWLHVRVVTETSSLDVNTISLLQNVCDDLPHSWKIEICAKPGSEAIAHLLEDSEVETAPNEVKPEKSLDDLYTELQELNSSPESLSKIEKMKLVFSAFCELQNKLMPLADNKPINECSEEEILSIITEYRSNNFFKDPENIAELLALIARAVYLDSHYEVRNVQILSVINFLLSNDKGLLLQIATGEGKSTITAMLAIAKVLQGESVDIVTSSPILALRDAVEKAKFYSMFGITVSHNCGNQQSGFKECYNADVVYGDVSNFQYDYLRHEYELFGTRGDRKFGVIIADEVDSMLIDEGSKIAMISSGIPGSEYLELVMVALWNRLTLLNQHLRLVDGKVVFVTNLGDASISTIPQDVEPEEENIVLEDAVAFKETQLNNYLDELLSAGNLVPDYMSEFIGLQRQAWIQSILKAENMEEGKNYILLTQEKKQIVAPVDYQNTGVIQANTSWSGGLHQFLQIKHCLKIVPEDLVAKFISNMEYFNKYGNKIFGMTGTLGSNDSKSFLSEQYNVALGHIPTFRAKSFVETSGVVVETEGAWTEAILDMVQQYTENNQAVLIIASTIRDAELIAEFFKNHGFPQNRVRLYTRSDNDGSSVIERVVESGEIIIATNLAGRGTDLKTSPKVERNGGLHVCVTFLPSNLRVEEQAFGRTSRQGNNGTAELIINIETLSPQFQKYISNTSSPITVGQLKEIRNQLEHARLEKISEFEAANLKLKDRLFNMFCEFTKEWRSAKQYQFKMAQIEEFWAMLIKRLDKEDALIDPLDAEAKFAQFKDHINSGIKGLGSFFTNPSYLVREGINKLGDHSDYKVSMSLFDQAASLEPGFTFAAYYYKAYAIIRDADMRYSKDGKRLNPNDPYLNNAATALFYTLNVIDGQLIPNLETMQMLLPQVGDSELQRQFKNKIEILEAHKKNINLVINKIKACDPEDGRIVISERQLLKEKLSLGQEDDKYEDEIRDFNWIGLFYLYDVVEVEYPTDIWSAVATAVLGVIQIAVGVMFAAVLNVGFVVSLFMSGIGDVFKSMKIFSGEEANWSNYFTEKAIEIAVTLICVGVEKIVDAAKAARAAKATNAAAQGAKVGTAQGISEAAIKTEVSKVGASQIVTESGKVVATKTSEEIAKETIASAIKQVAVKTAVNHIVDYVADVGIEELLRNFKGKIKSESHSKIDKLLSDPVVSQALLKIAVEEERTKYRYSDVIYNQIYSVFSSKQSILSRIGSGVLSSLAAANNAHVAIRVADKGLMVAKIATAIEGASEVLEEMSSNLRNKILTIANNIDTTETIITKHLRRYGEVDPESRAAEIGAIFTKERVIVEGKIVHLPQKGLPGIESTSRQWQILYPVLQKLQKAQQVAWDHQRLGQSKQEISERFCKYASQMIHGQISNGVLKPVVNPMLASITTPLVEGVIDAAKEFHQNHLLKKKPTLVQEITLLAHKMEGVVPGGEGSAERAESDRKMSPEEKDAYDAAEKAREGRGKFAQKGQSTLGDNVDFATASAEANSKSAAEEVDQQPGSSIFGAAKAKVDADAKRELNFNNRPSHIAAKLGEGSEEAIAKGGVLGEVMQYQGNLIEMLSEDAGTLASRHLRKAKIVFDSANAWVNQGLSAHQAKVGEARDLSSESTVAFVDGELIRIPRYVAKESEARAVKAGDEWINNHTTPAQRRAAEFWSFAAIAKGTDMLGSALKSKPAGLAKTHYELPHKTGHKDASSIFFKKSVDDSGIGLKSKSGADVVASKIAKVEVGAVGAEVEHVISKEWTGAYKKTFPSEVIWEAPAGTKQIYKVHQRADINWDHVRTAGPREFVGKTNREAALAGKAPELADGYFATLHHTGQRSTGPLVETTTKLHSFENKEAFRILHNQTGGRKKHPELPVDHRSFAKEKAEYWKWRVKNDG